MLTEFWTHASIQTIEKVLKGAGGKFARATSLTCEYEVLVSRSGPPTKTICSAFCGHLRRRNHILEVVPHPSMS